MTLDRAQLFKSVKFLSILDLCNFLAILLNKLKTTVHFNKGDMAADEFLKGCINQ